MISAEHSPTWSTTTLENESTIEPTEAAERPLRIVIAGGGTGGHISPAVAVIDELRSRFALVPLWIGSAEGYEATVADTMSIPFRVIRTGKLRRYASFQTILDTVRFPIGVAQARAVVRQFQPDIIFSTGGFVSVPSVIAGRTLGIPVLTHEQTAYIGLATRINARFCDVVALSFDRSKQYLPSRTTVVVTGNPIRQAVLGGNPTRGLTALGFDETLPVIYITGGALGSRAINAAVRDALPELLEHAQLLHQCGPRTAHDDVEQLNHHATLLPDRLRCRYVVREHVGDELGDVYAAATLVVGRAGAGTVNELATLGLPAILIPLPGAEEQRQNALVLVEAGNATMLQQDDLTAASLTDRILGLLSDTHRLDGMRRNSQMFDANQPARLLADELIRLARDGGYPSAA